MLERYAEELYCEDAHLHGLPRPFNDVQDANATTFLCSSERQKEVDHWDIGTLLRPSTVATRMEAHSRDTKSLCFHHTNGICRSIEKNLAV